MPPDPSELPPTPPAGFPPPSNPPVAEAGVALPSDEPFVRHADPTLEARLPKNVGGTSLVVYSLAADDFAEAGNARFVDGVLARVGKARDDVTFAAAVDPLGSLRAWAAALRVAGVDGSELLSAVVEVEASEAVADASVEEVALAGRKLTSVSFGHDAPTQYLYAVGDTVYAVYGSAESVTLLLQEMP